MKISRPKVDTVAVSAAFEMNFAGAVSDETIAARFTYNVFEPFAVTAAFTLGGAGTAVHWVMSRDMVREGIVMPAGIGDIRIYPVADTFYIELNSPSGRAILEGPLQPLITFINSVFAAVPENREHEFFSVDAELDLLSDLYVQRDNGLEA